MAEARQEQWWDVASAMMALVANCHRDSKTRSQPYYPEEFNPLSRRGDDQPLQIGVGVLKDVFVKSGRTPRLPPPNH